MKEKILFYINKKISLTEGKFSKEEIERIIDQTSFLDENTSFSERCFNIIHEISSEVKCKECLENKPEYLRINTGYRMFCSSTCKNKWMLRETDILQRISSSSKKAYENFSISDIEEQHKKRRRTMEMTFKMVPKCKMSAKKVYFNEVKKYTERNDITILENHEKGGRNEVDGSFQLDHKFSKLQGFIDSIPPEIIGSIYNLEMLSSEENARKKYHCSITKQELLSLYYSTEMS